MHEIGISISPYLNGLHVQTLIARIQTNYRRIYITINTRDQVEFPINLIDRTRRNAIEFVKMATRLTHCLLSNR